MKLLEAEFKTQTIARDVIGKKVVNIATPDPKELTMEAINQGLRLAPLPKKQSFLGAAAKEGNFSRTAVMEHLSHYAFKNGHYVANSKPQIALSA